MYDIKNRDVSNPIADSVWLKLLYTNNISPKADLQGICTDGRYLYAVEYNRSTIYKYDILGGTITSTTYSDNVCGHGNDATYNPNTNKIYIATCNNDGGQGIAVFTTDLEYVENIIVYNSLGANQKIAGIAYDRQNNVYRCCWADDHYLYDSNFNLLEEFTVQHEHNYTYAGIETDGSYIYRLLWDNVSSPHTNYLAVYDFSGNLVKILPVDNNKESEAIAYDWNGNWYVGINVDGGIGWYLYYAGVKRFAEIGTVAVLGELIAN
jgi:DNA-binding beta-propeller fold protein YncE